MTPLMRAIGLAVLCWPLVTMLAVGTLYDKYSQTHIWNPYLAWGSTTLMYALVIGSMLTFAHHTWDLNATQDD